MTRGARINVSDHALIRYIERVLCVDLEPVRKQIAGKVEDAIEAIERAGAEWDRMETCQ